MQVCQPSRQPSAWVSQRVAPEGVERPLRAIRAGFLLYLSCTILSMEPAFFTTPATRGPSARVSIQPRKYTSLGGLRRSWLRALVSATLAAELMGKLEPIRGKRTLCSSTERADFAALAAVDHLLQQRSPRVHLPGWVGPPGGSQKSPPALLPARRVAPPLARGRLHARLYLT